MSLKQNSEVGTQSCDMATAVHLLPNPGRAARVQNFSGTWILTSVNMQALSFLMWLKSLHLSPMWIQRPLWSTASRDWTHWVQCVSACCCCSKQNWRSPTQNTVSWCPWGQSPKLLMVRYGASSIVQKMSPSCQARLVVLAYTLKLVTGKRRKRKLKQSAIGQTMRECVGKVKDHAKRSRKEKAAGGSGRV